MQNINVIQKYNIIYHEWKMHKTPSIWPQKVETDRNCNGQEENDNKNNSVNPVNVELEVDDNMKQQQHLHATKSLTSIPTGWLNLQFEFSNSSSKKPETSSKTKEPVKPIIKWIISTLLLDSAREILAITMQFIFSEKLQHQAWKLY